MACDHFLLGRNDQLKTDETSQASVDKSAETSQSNILASLQKGNEVSVMVFCRRFMIITFTVHDNVVRYTKHTTESFKG